MRRTIAIACALAMIAGGAQAQGSGAQATVPQKPYAAMTKKKKASTQKPSPAVAAAPVAHPAPVAPAQVAPPVPATLMNSAPVNPNVTMKDGLLTIDAPNSTLGAVLNGVRNATGAEVEGASPSERVAVRLGPGAPRQVIAALLKGTPYDYLILGSVEKPDAVTRIVLTQSQGETTAQNGPGHTQRPGVQATQPVNEVPDSPPPDEVQPAGEIQADQTQPPPQPQPDQSTPQNTPQSTPQNTPKTPEELFKELMPGQQPAQQPGQQPPQQPAQ